MKDAAYYRARNNVIGKYISKETDDKRKRWLQYGFIPDEYEDEFEKECEETQKLYKSKDGEMPLTFTDMTTYSTWFAMHPEKVAGRIEGGSSLFFPVVVKGSRNDVENLINSVTKEDSSDDDMMELELEAEALELELKLSNV